MSTATAALARRYAETLGCSPAPPIPAPDRLMIRPPPASRISGTNARLARGHAADVDEERSGTSRSIATSSMRPTGPSDRQRCSRGPRRAELVARRVAANSANAAGVGHVDRSCVDDRATPRSRTCAGRVVELRPATARTARAARRSTPGRSASGAPDPTTGSGHDARPRVVGCHDLAATSPRRAP